MAGEDNNLFNPRNKQFWVLLILFLLGVMLLLLGSCTGNGAVSGPQQAPPGNEPAAGAGEEKPVGQSVMTREERELAAELQQMLEQVAGAGQVQVTVQLATSTHSDYAINTTTGLKTTEEQDQDGGSRQITENTDSRTVVIARGGQGYETPVVKREVAPDLAGVLVVAEGAGIPRVKADLFRAAQVALGVEPHKIIVLPMKRGD
ncbi:stage III sporulation protein AG [Desulfoscipio geothermicus]|uniref:Stage III sporulation protein AG n=1 Tax=Desulfoscipio geothermicus DSM 3669 TaxID=1121426 RepID=A0A1I6DB57_9FIRM|nr:stage III sporulation protein AG [Desulfoscipio geothermicus]SFR02683.1 stage III sporulation protein AG [Desulfoscipio geothermicus DSM 3669]